MMKKMWKKNSKAVSPVIATILMVAITVVLAAVLYVMVMGFGGETTNAPTASLTVSGSRLTIQLSEAQEVTTDMALSVMLNGTQFDFAASGATIGDTAGTQVVWTDAGGDGKVSGGDYFTLVSPSHDVIIKLIWTSGGTNTVLAEATL